MTHGFAPNLTLRRTERIADGNFGTLAVGGLVLCTVEDDWRDNAPQVSCIPAGSYPLVRTVWHAKGIEVFEVADVPGRSRILIHPANTEEDLLGCIGIGLRRGFLMVPDEDDPTHPLVRKNAVVDAQTALRRFMRAMAPYDEARLTIVEDYT